MKGSQKEIDSANYSQDVNQSIKLKQTGEIYGVPLFTGEKMLSIDSRDNLTV